MLKNNERKKAYKKIEWMFSHWAKIKQAVVDARLAREDVPKDSNVGGRSSFISDPTAAQAMRNLIPVNQVDVDGTEIRKPEAWLDLIQLVYNHCNKTEKDIFDLRYQRRKNPVQISMEMCMAESTYYDIINGMRSYAVELALQAGLIIIYRF